MKPKRFLVFTGPCYYAGGGWKDFSGSADTLEEAMRIVAKDYECDEKNSLSRTGKASQSSRVAQRRRPRDRRDR